MLSSSDSVLLVCDGEEHGLTIYVLNADDGGSGVVCVVLRCCL